MSFSNDIVFEILSFFTCGNLPISHTIHLNCVNKQWNKEYDRSIRKFGYTYDGKEKNITEFNKFINSKYYKYCSSLILPDKFNIKIELSTKLKTLVLGKKFNRKIELPETLTKFYMYPYDSIFERGEFNKNIILPNNINELLISGSFDKDINLPNSLKRLFINSKIYNKHLNIPDTCEELYFQNDVYTNEIELPKNLIKFTMGDMYNKPIILPDTLQKFVMGHCYRNYELILPKNLKIFKMNFMYNKPLILNDNLEEFYMNDNYLHKIIIPKNLKKFRPGIDFFRMNPDYVHDENCELLQ